MIKTIVEYRWDMEPFWFKFKIFIEFKIENLRFNLETALIFISMSTSFSPVSITQDTQFFSSILTDSLVISY